MNPRISFDARSMLCVPADASRFFMKAGDRGADLIVLDLEDGVAFAAKAAARAALAAAVPALMARGATIYVRVNNDPALLQQDLRHAVQSGAAGVVVPKLESAAEVLALDEALGLEERSASRLSGEVRVIGLVETPVGVCRAFEIAQASQRFVSLGLGSEDFATAMGMEPTMQSLSGPAQSVAIAAVAAGLHPIGLPGPVGNFTDTRVYRELVQHARALGIRGAICIHPAQVGVLNEVMSGTKEEVAAAARIVAAFDAALAKGQGSIAVDGHMVDAPIANRSRILLARARVPASPLDIRPA